MRGVSHGFKSGHLKEQLHQNVYNPCLCVSRHAQPCSDGYQAYLLMDTVKALSCTDNGDNIS